MNSYSGIGVQEDVAPLYIQLRPAGGKTCVYVGKYLLCLIGIGDLRCCQMRKLARLNHASYRHRSLCYNGGGNQFCICLLL